MPHLPPRGTLGFAARLSEFQGLPLRSGEISREVFRGGFFLSRAVLSREVFRGGFFTIS